jgi:hypothetical protein
LREYLPIRIFFQHKLTVIVNEGGEDLFFVIPCENFLSTVYFSTGEAYRSLVKKDFKIHGKLEQKHHKEKKMNKLNLSVGSPL